MAYHTAPLIKAKKQGEMPLPSLTPIPLKKVEFRDGMGLRLGNGISSCFLALLRYDRPSLNPFCFSEKFFCELFRVHEMCSQLR